MDETQAQAQDPAADEQAATTPTISPSGNGSSDAQPSPVSMHEADNSSSNADLSSTEAGTELQPDTLSEPKGGTAGNEPPIATALSDTSSADSGNEPPIATALSDTSSADIGAQDEISSTLADVQASRAADEIEVSTSDVDQAAAGEVPSEQPWRPADVATEVDQAAAGETPSEPPAQPADVAVEADQAAAGETPSEPPAQPADVAVEADQAIAGVIPSEEPWRPGDVAVEAQATPDQPSTPAPAPPSPAAPSAPSATGGETMEELMSMYGQQSFKALKYGDVVEGRIMRVGKDELLVDIGAKSEGIVPSNELSDLSPAEFAELKEGDEILVSVVTPEDNEGHAVLSLNRARQEKSWRKLQRQFDAGEIINVEISGYNKGGLLVNLEGVRGFVPSSQVTGLGGSDQAKQADLQAMVGRQIGLKIIEINRNRNRLILSERLALSAQREVMKERLLSELKPGDIRHGRVVSIADFGAFVDIGGADGLVHLSELSWSRVSHPSEVLKVGQEVDVYVLSVDEHDRKIALSLKRTQHEPWMDITSRYQVGQLVEGTITQLATFGAFARIADGVEGLIHVSELSEGRIVHPRDAVKEGDRLTLRIIRIDPQRKRIGLSLKRAVEGASMDDILAEGQPGEGRGERGPRPERSGEFRGERGGEFRGERSGGERGGGERRDRGERGGGDRGERRERGERGGDRRPREAQVPAQTTFGGGGASAMELAIRGAMAQQRDEAAANEPAEQTPEIETPRSAMNTVGVTLNTNTPPPAMPHIAEPEPANAEALDQAAAPTPAQDEALASEVVSQIGATPSDEAAAGEQQAANEPASNEASQLVAPQGSAASATLPDEPTSATSERGEAATDQHDGTTSAANEPPSSRPARQPAASATSASPTDDTADRSQAQQQDSSAATSEPTNEAAGGEIVTGESFAAGGTTDADTFSTLEANQAEAQAVSDITAPAEQAGSDTVIPTTQGFNASATEETGTGSEAASQHGEAGGASSDREETSAANRGNANLEWVHGIGPKYNQVLGSAGIRSNEDLANATQEQLRALGFEHESDEELNNWIQQAKDKIAASG